MLQHKISIFKYSVLLSLVLSPFLIGCGSQQQHVRNSELLLAALTNKVKEEVEQYAKSRAIMNKALQRNMNILEMNAKETENKAALKRSVWFIVGGKKDRRVLLYDQILEAAQKTADNQERLSQLQEKHEQLLAKTNTAVNVRSAKLAETAEALGKLAAKPDLRAQLTFYLSYFKDVAKSVKEAEDKANAAKKEDGAKDTKTDETTPNT